jgi:hypothetical protein
MLRHQTALPSTKAALQLSIRVIRVIRGQPLKRRKPFSIFNAVNHIDFYFVISGFTSYQ